MNIEDTLKPGDIIRFHNWFVGGFLFGVIKKSEIDTNKLEIWRKKRTFCLQDVDAITIIKTIDDIQNYEKYAFNQFIQDMKSCNMTYYFSNEK